MVGVYSKRCLSTSSPASAASAAARGHRIDAIVFCLVFCLLLEAAALCASASNYTVSPRSPDCDNIVGESLVYCSLSSALVAARESDGDTVMIVLADGEGSAYTITPDIYTFAARQVSLVSANGIARSIISCSGQSSDLMFDLNNSLQFDKVTFTNCSGIFLQRFASSGDFSSVTLRDVSFNNIGQNGVNIQLFDVENPGHPQGLSQVNLVECDFVASTSVNITADMVSISGCTFKRLNTHSYPKPTVQIKAISHVTINTTNFCLNSAGTVLGNIYVETCPGETQVSTVVVDNCYVASSIVTQLGTFTVFSNSGPDAQVYVSISDSTFYNNSADVGGGVKIYSEVSNTTVMISNRTFDMNQAIGGGGGIALVMNQGPMTAVISSSTFTRLTSKRGSAIYLQSLDNSYGALTLWQSLVSNSITTVTGVIEAFQWNVILLDSLITRNQGYSGIIVMNRGTSGSMTGCDVSLNYVGSSDGTGAVVLTGTTRAERRQEGQESASFNISKSSINLNTGYANGLYAAGVNVTITDSYIWSNVQHGIICNGLGTIVDASQSDSIYQNAWGLPDAMYLKFVLG
eukprot:TRINITY_DN5275_c0_g2_i1.p1 TRINITY_DN5275_c0_g2~~TRINITY_DN5275_c0_g2_i1.p1  ORF type:complete len:575 (-),score=35.07 TRINITY_DN5275_c0_g2_i1:17-1741(-)